MLQCLPLREISGQALQGANGWKSPNKTLLQSFFTFEMVHRLCHSGRACNTSANPAICKWLNPVELGIKVINHLNRTRGGNVPLRKFKTF